MPAMRILSEIEEWRLSTTWAPKVGKIMAQITCSKRCKVLKGFGSRVARLMGLGPNASKCGCILGVPDGHPPGEKT